MAFDIPDSNHTQVAYIGRNWEEAKEYYLNNHHPFVEEFLNRTGSHISVEDMEMLENTNSEAFAQLEATGNWHLYAVDMCQDNCLRTLKGHLTYINGANATHFKRATRGPEGLGVCSNCPKQLDYRPPAGEGSSITDPKPNTALIKDEFIVRLDTDGFQIESHTARPFRGLGKLKPEIRHAFLKFLRRDMPQFLTDAMPGFPDILVYDKPFIQRPDQDLLRFEEPEMEFKVQHFQLGRPRYFIGPIKPLGNRAFQSEMIESLSSINKSSEREILLPADSSVLIWIPPADDMNNTEGNWRDRVHPEAEVIIDEFLNYWKGRHHRVEITTRPGYPGFFIFFKNVIPFFTRSKRESKIPTLTGLFYQLRDCNQIKEWLRTPKRQKLEMQLFWRKANSQYGMTSDSGTTPHLRAIDGRIDLLMMLDSEINEEGVEKYPNPRLIFKDAVAGKVDPNVKLTVDAAGCCWLSLRFANSGEHLLRIRTGKDTSFRDVLITVDQGIDNIDSLQIFCEEDWNGPDSIGNTCAFNIQTKLEIVEDNRTILINDCYDQLGWIEDLSRHGKQSIIEDAARVTFEHKCVNDIEGEEPSISGTSWSRHIRQVSYFLQILKWPDDEPEAIGNLGDLNRRLLAFDYAPREEIDDPWRWVARPPSAETIPNLDEWCILYDPRSNQNLEEILGDDFRIDRRTGLRFIATSALGSLGIVADSARPDTDTIFRTAGAYLHHLWNSVSDQATPLPTNSEGVATFRWTITEADTAFHLLSRSKLRTRANQMYQTGTFQPPQQDYRNRWLGVAKFNQATAIEIESGRLFLQWNVMDPEGRGMSGDVEWSLYLGHFSLIDGSEKGIVIGVSKYSVEKHAMSWLDPFGRVVDDDGNCRLDLSFLRYPRTSGKTLDTAYLIRETFRAFATISGVTMPSTQYGGWGEPGFIENPDVSHSTNIAAAVGRVFSVGEEERELIKQQLRNRLRERLWWRVEDAD